MIAIQTYFLGPTNKLPRRIVAVAPGGQRKVLSAYSIAVDGLNNEDAQRRAAELLANQYGWLKGYKLVGGGYNDRMYWVFVEENAK